MEARPSLAHIPGTHISYVIFGPVSNALPVCGFVESVHSPQLCQFILAFIMPLISQKAHQN